jgi:hypothetical protein
MAQQAGVHLRGGGRTPEQKAPEDKDSERQKVLRTHDREDGDREMRAGTAGKNDLRR